MVLFFPVLLSSSVSFLEMERQNVQLLQQLFDFSILQNYSKWSAIGTIGMDFDFHGNEMERMAFGKLRNRSNAVLFRNSCLQADRVPSFVLLIRGIDIAFTMR